MKYLWLFYLPLLYLPNMGFARETPFGVVEMSDFLIGPYIFLLVLSLRKQPKIQLDNLIPVLCFFLFWATLSTLLIDFRYGYTDSYFIVFGLLKLSKMTLYGIAGILTIKALNHPKKKLWYNWSLLVCGLFVAASLWMTIGSDDKILSYQDIIDRQTTGYKATNAISVMMAMLLCCLAGLWTKKQGSDRWQRAVFLALVFIIAGFSLSQGRGGWVAMIAGILFLLYKIGVRKRVLAGICLVLVVSFGAYHYFPNFRNQVDKTLHPDQNLFAVYGGGIAGHDDGARLKYFLKEAAKFIEAPVLGTGFFHRGFEFSKSGLDKVGSHNFWLQMFLETGLIGGSLVLFMFWRMWRQARFFEKSGDPKAIPVQAALVAAFIGGMSGEYFYGGMVLFTLFIVYAPLGALPLKTQICKNYAGIRINRTAKIKIQNDREAVNA